MGFSDEFIYENYKKYYKIAERAKEEGDFGKMKKALYKAADYMEMIAQSNRGEVAHEQFMRAERMRKVADSIKEDVISAAKRNTSVKNGAFTAGAISASNGVSEDILPEEMTAFVEIYSPEDLEFGFEEVVGLQEAKDAVREYVINPRLYPDAYSYNFLDGASLMLEGPPGTGKTTFAKALAKELNQPFIVAKISGIVNCYVGETAKNIDKLLLFLRNYAKNEGCEITVFFDELDEIAKSRGSDDKASESAVPALLRNLGAIKENNGLLIIANTNCKDILDKAIIDRFRRSIYIPLPDAKTREHLFKLKLKEVEDKYISQLDFAKLVQASEKMNGRQITYACDDFKRMISKAKAGLISLGNLTESFVKILLNR